MSSLSELPEEVLFLVFGFLDASSLVNVSHVCKSWRAITSNWRLWKKLCDESFQTYVYRRESTSSGYETEEFNHKKRAMDNLRIYNKSRKSLELTSIFESWERLVNFLQNRCPEALIYLNYGASEQDILKLNQQYGGTVPEDILFSLSLFDGEEASDDASPGIFGEYSFYDQGECMELLSSHDILAKTRPQLRESGVIPLLSCKRSDTAIITFSKFFDGNQPRQMSYTPSRGRQRIIVANTFSDYMTDYSGKVVSGFYSLKNSQISLWPPYGPPTITNGVKIATSVRFVPQESYIMGNRSQYVFAYQISISMDEDEDPSLTCTLVNRHWEINRGAARNEVVDGPGVIGYFPRISPGTVFEYASCCPISSSAGWMEGHFGFTVDRTGESFNAIVGRFPLTFPF